MSNQTDPVKQNIIDWCNADGIQVVDESSKIPDCEWFLVALGNTMIFKLKKFSDRIYFQSKITISKNHQKIIADNQKMRVGLVLQIPTIVLQMDASCAIEQNDTTITKVITSKVHYHSTIKKADFLTKLAKVQDVHTNLLNRLSVQLQTTAKQLQENQPAPAPDARDVGVG